MLLFCVLYTCVVIVLMCLPYNHVNIGEKRAEPKPYCKIKFLYAVFKTGRIMLWRYPSICPSVTQSRHTFASKSDNLKTLCLFSFKYLYGLIQCYPF